MGYAQLLDMQYDDPNIAEATRSILKGGQHLLQLVNEVLDLSRIESGIFAISLEPVSVEEVLGDAIGMVQPLADRDGIRLVIDWAGCKNLYLEADRQRLVQVLVNLLGNGIKYNRPNGRVTVLCRAKSETSARIEVVDTGFGISPVDQKRLFEPFQRFGDHLVEGTGLGLALSERFMRLMGGRLGLSESSETGSTFFVDLPCSVSPDQNPESTTRLDSSPSSQVTCTGTVLYIEDNPTNLRLLEAVFAETPNLVLLTAPDGKLGFELAIQGQPDLILLDLHLPEQHGDQVLRRLKEEVTTRSIPVVMISADATPKQMQTLIAAGAVDYLTKPIELRRLFDVLGEYLPGPVLRD
jgi:CheY-like chemotaxis protein